MAIKDNIKMLRKRYGLTQQELAEIAGVTNKAVWAWENGLSEPRMGAIERIAAHFNLKKSNIIEEGGMDLEGLNKTKNKQVVSKSPHSLATHTYPYLPVSISAGLPTDVDPITSDEVETISISDAVMGKWAGRKDIFIMRVNGDSMNKIIPHNSLIAVRQVELSQLKDGDIVVYSDGTSYAVKHFYNDKVNRKLIFRPASTDTSFTDYIVPYSEAENIKIHGKVVVYVVELN